MDCYTPRNSGLGIDMKRKNRVEGLCGWLKLKPFTLTVLAVTPGRLLFNKAHPTSAAKFNIYSTLSLINDSFFQQWVRPLLCLIIM